MFNKGVTNPGDMPVFLPRIRVCAAHRIAPDGAIKLAFFPRIGVELGKLSLYEHKGSKVFAAVNSARVSVDLLLCVRVLALCPTGAGRYLTRLGKRVSTLCLGCINRWSG